MKKVTLLLIFSLVTTARGASLMCDTLLTRLLEGQEQLVNFGTSAKSFGTEGSTRSKALAAQARTSYQTLGQQLNQEKETFVEICLK